MTSNNASASTYSKLERLVNNFAAKSAEIFNAKGELVPFVVAINVPDDGEAQAYPIDGGERFFSGPEGKEALASLIEHVMTNAPPGINPATLVVSEVWATFGPAAQKLVAEGGTPSQSSSREEAIALNLVLPDGETYIHFLRIDPISRKVELGEAFTIQADPEIELNSRFARRRTLH